MARLLKVSSLLVDVDGNLKGISKLVAGKNIDDVIALLRGNTCRNKPTSCPDQLTYALEEAYKAQNINE